MNDSGRDHPSLSCLSPSTLYVLETELRPRVCPQAPLRSEPSHQPLQFHFLFIYIGTFFQPSVPIEILEQGNHRNGSVFGDGHSDFRRRQDRGEKIPEIEEQLLPLSSQRPAVMGSHLERHI